MTVILEAPIDFSGSPTPEKEVDGTHSKAVPCDDDATKGTIEDFLRNQAGAIDALLDNLREQIEDDIGQTVTVDELSGAMTIAVDDAVVSAVRDCA